MVIRPERGVFVMKKALSICLALVLLCCAPLALAATNTFRTDNSFSMNFDNLNGTEAHAMALKKGDALYLSTLVKSGEISILIRRDAGETLFEGSKEPEAGFTLEIPEDGIYRFTITGKQASGSVVITMANGKDEGPATLPLISRIYVTSELGYRIEYDPSYFVYQAEEGADLFYAKTQRLGNPLDVSLSLQRAESSLSSMANHLMSEEGFKETAPLIIDWRAARTFALDPAPDYDGLVQTYTVVECGEDEVLVILATYFNGAEGASERMQNMIETIQFLY